MFWQYSSSEKLDTYSPKKYIPTGEYLQRVEKLPLTQQKSIAEVLHGATKKRTFYVSLKPKNKLNSNLNLAPSFSVGIPANMNVLLGNAIIRNEKSITIEWSLVYQNLI